jgi:hypothetical protein
MRYRVALLALLFVLRAIPALAFESRPAEAKERRLRLELEVTPSPLQRNFDRYIEELAAGARQDAFYGEQARKQEEARARERKVLNPIALFRW